jgi:hypothetical protein
MTASGCLLAAVLAGLLLLIMLPGSPAADYSFEVPSEQVWVRVNADSSLDFRYTIEFRCDPGANPIDIVDIGMPNTNYYVSECTASVDGRELEEIKPSTVVTPGVEVHLNEYAIQPGSTGKFVFHGKNPQMVFTDTSRAGYASMQFKNTWWDQQYAHGTTNLSFSIQFPRGVKPNETVWHQVQYNSTSVNEDCIVFTWNNTTAVPCEGYVYGVSFPAIYVSGVYPEQPLPDYTPAAPSGTSYSSSSSSISFWIMLGLIIITTLARAGFSAKTVHKRGAKVAYIKPSVAIEGAGPAKGLLPAEAALLLEQELDRVAAIGYFEMLGSGVIALESVKPLKLLHSSVESLGSVSGRGYYPEFVAALSTDGELEGGTLKLAFKSLIKSLEKKMQGFSPAETAKYHEEAARSSWAEVLAARGPADKLAAFEKYLPWLLLDTSFGSKARQAFPAGSAPMPGWAQGQAGALEGGGLAGGDLGDVVARTFVGIQDAAYKLTKEMQPEIVKEVYPEEYRRIYVGRRAFVGGGGGGGCACACACAGCACACAGGGR